MTERTPEERLARVDERFAVTVAGYDQLLAGKGYALCANPLPERVRLAVLHLRVG